MRLPERADEILSQLIEDPVHSRLFVAERGTGGVGEFLLPGLGRTGTVHPPGLYGLAFVASGTPAMSGWTVDLNAPGTCGPSYWGSSASTSLTFFVPNGSYVFGVGGPLGASVVPDHGSVAVNGSPGTVTIDLAPAPTAAQGFLGYPGSFGYGLLGTIVAATVLCVGELVRRSRH